MIELELGTKHVLLELNGVDLEVPWCHSLRDILGWREDGGGGCTSQHPEAHPFLFSPPGHN